MLAVRMEGLEYNIKELNKVHIQKSKSSRLRKKVLISTVLSFRSSTIRFQVMDLTYWHLQNSTIKVS